MLSTGRDGPGFRSYLALQGGAEAVITALLKDIELGQDSDPDNQTGPNPPNQNTRRIPGNKGVRSRSAEISTSISLDTDTSATEWEETAGGPITNQIYGWDLNRRVVFFFINFTLTD